MLDIPQLNKIFQLQVDICRYCGEKCEVSMQEHPIFGIHPYSECPSCKENLKYYSGSFLIQRDKEALIVAPKNSISKQQCN